VPHPAWGRNALHIIPLLGGAAESRFQKILTASDQQAQVGFGEKKKRFFSFRKIAAHSALFGDIEQPRI